MNKPKYKLGDMIQDKISKDIEIIIAITPYGDKYQYKTQYDDPRDKYYCNGRFTDWLEPTIDHWYTVIGNLFDKEKQHD